MAVESNNGGSIPTDEKELFNRLKAENAKLVKWWERMPEDGVSFERKGTYNPLTGEIE